MRHLKLATFAAALALGAPGAALACLPPLPMTAEEEAAFDQRVQADLWSRYDLIFVATVTGVAAEASSEAEGPDRIPVPTVDSQRIRVQMTPGLLIKGEAPLPQPYEMRDILVGCAPQGIQRAEVGQAYVIYAQAREGPGAAGGIIPAIRVRDQETLDAWAVAAQSARPH